ncbi:methyltransferase domain-containing protein [Candidatus Woesearchaeota archaeon]|nr:methyltransferase domain-containing protein [Candidatus Woesearchaeota archaeon]
MPKLQPWVISEATAKERSKRNPPTAPDKAEQEIYKKYAETANGNCLILGATPELRDISLENGLKTYTVDLSRKMMDMGDKCMKHKNHPDETKIIENWFDMKFDNNFFNIVMADASFCNLSTKEENEKLLGILKRIIMPNGYFVLRNIFLPEIEKIPLKEVVSSYRQKKMNLFDFFAELRIVTYLDKVYNKETYQYDAKKNFELIEEDYKKGIFNKEELYKLMLFRNNIINTFYPKKEFLKLVESFGFKLIESFENNRFRFNKYLTMHIFQKLFK